MFMVGFKAAIIQALRRVFDAEFQTDDPGVPFPRHIATEFAEHEQDWPFIMVQFHVGEIRWTGIDPDRFTLKDPSDSDYDEDNPWSQIRKGYFEGAIDLGIYSTKSEERDRMWDTLVKLFLMGRTKQVTRDFYDFIEAQTMIGIVVQEGSIEPIGDAIVPGTPWNDEEITFEATLRVPCVGEFWMRDTEVVLPPLLDVEVIPQEVELVSIDETTGEIATENPDEPVDDGEGPWKEFGDQ